MSEYQYYEFRTIDSPLTEKQQKEIGRWSSRTQPTSTGAIFIYNYGDFPKSARQVVEQYFDAMFYIANWGTTRLIFKFPKDLVDIDSMQQYCIYEEVSVSETDDYVLLEFHFSDEEGYGWVDGEGWLTSLIGLRHDILHGDYRSLYLAWLHTCSLHSSWEDFDYDVYEPQIPADLDRPNGSLKSFIELLHIDKDLLTVVTRTASAKSREPAFDIKNALKNLSSQEKNEFLVRLAKGEALLSVRLLKRLRELSTIQSQVPVKECERTVGMILKETEKVKQQQIEIERELKEKRRLEKIKELEENEQKLWEEVYQHIAEKKPKAYDAAIKILKSLHMLAKHKKTQDEFEKNIQQILQEFSRLSSLKSKIIGAKLINDIG